MHPDKIITLIKDHVNDFSQNQYASLLCILGTYNDLNNIIVPLEDNNIRVLNGNDIYYIHSPKKNIVFIYAEKEKIEYCSPKTNLLEYMNNNNENFRYLNNNLIVNTKVMVSYNSYYRKVYLSNGAIIDATGAAINNIVSKVLGKENDLCKDNRLKNYAF